ncbi:bifunctional helix-turn-helix transcriptional regulator/GNAT family N-acetyltransferase [Puia dinghuensis]|uniref:MarR family transcriptional regulator n=1 Tax=Puia dinghuensis TaxID=1792502 RepID=A0A8J2XV77_9BACT|nr:GNAT family N-acetyltransferase [Puia dinghuensis]GGB14109.1 MarR family transcriptional regulator [Puia dinghuensis]
MDFYDRTGKMALGSRLRRLSEQMTEQAAAIYDLYQVDLHPKWFPVFYSLSPSEEKSITDIAREIGHTHPSVSQIVREMSAKGYIVEKKGEMDGRKNFVLLSPAGEQVREKMQAQLDDVTSVIEKAMKETHHDLWKAIAEWEFLLEQKSLLRRVQEEKKVRESQEVQIIDYTPEYQPVFRQLNEEWITKYFRMEESDYKALDHPQEYIIDKGGHIYMALYKGEPLGTCAIIPMDDGGFELAKMAVSPRAQGLGIGYLVGKACIEKARALGAPRVYLESNTTLKPAINLYYKLGFRKAAGPPSPYERCNIQMELVF